jgi:hypothetical protein
VWTAVGATFLVFSAAIVDTLLRLRPGGYVPGSDNAAIEYVTRQVGQRAVLVGVYSRFGWHHPGPALFYLFAGPYRLLGSSSAALPLTALLVNVASIIGVAVVLHRRAGVGMMLWGLLVIAVYLRWLDPGFLRSDWNPDVPLLPFTLLVLLCWTLRSGDRWALPVVVGVGSFCVQSHVSYALGVAAVFFVTAVGVAVEAISRRRSRRAGGSTLSLRGWVKPASLALVVTGLLWAPPLYDELRGHPGNLTQLVDYFRNTHPDWSYRQGWGELVTAAGRLPAWISGQHPRSQLLAPSRLPTWTGSIALGAVLLAFVRAAFRRRRQQLQLLGLTAAVAVAAVFAVRQVVGPLYPYLVEWTWTAGLLLWIAVGFVVLDGVRLPSNLAARTTAYSALAGFVVIGGITGVRTAQIMPRDVPAARQLSAAVQHWLAARPPGTVRVDFASTVKPSLLGATIAGDGLVLALDRAGVDVQVVSASAKLVFGPASTDHVNRARWVVVIALDRGRSPPNRRGLHLLDTAGGYQVYAGAAHPAP